MSKGSFLIVLLVCCAGLASCAGLTPVVHEEKTAAGITLLFTNGTGGALEPEGCGCRRQGGLARRAQFIEQAKKGTKGSVPVIVLDTGGVLPEQDAFSGPELNLNAEYLFAALNLMGTDALNIGQRDCVLGIPGLKDQGSRVLFPLLSANLRDGRTGAPLFQPYLIKKIAPGIKIGIFGLAEGTEPSLRDPQVVIDSPPDSAQRAVLQLQAEGCSVIILLSQLARAENEKIAAAVPAIDFILGSTSQAVMTEPHIMGGTALMSPGTGGKHIGVLDLTLQAAAAPFYNARHKEEVVLKIAELKDMEAHREHALPIEEVVLKRTLMEEKLRSFEGKNSYRYTCRSLDGSVQESPQVKLLIEKYKEQLLRSRRASYVNSVQEVAGSGLSEEQTLRALRLMNEIDCDQGESIAQSAASRPFCRKLALMIIDGITHEHSEGKIRFSIQYEKERAKKNLDNALPLE